MIPKGNQRGGGQQLATHLLNAYDNDSAEVADVRPRTKVRNWKICPAKPDGREGALLKESCPAFAGRGGDLQPFTNPPEYT